MQAHQRRRIGRRRHHHRARQANFPQNIIDKIFYLAPTLPNQPHHHDIGSSVACHHAQQNTFTNTATRKQAQSLPAPDAQQRVDRTHTDIQGGINGRTLHGVNWRCHKG